MKELATRITQIALAAFFIAILKTFAPDASVPIPSKQATPDFDAQQLLDEQDHVQTGIAQSVLDNTRLGATDLKNILDSLPVHKKYGSFGFKDSYSRVFTHAATAINKKHYIANSFLLGFVPFRTEKIWVPLATLSQRKRYLFDHKQYGPHMRDVWQNSKQAYVYSRGDCEDHALLLADWLIGLGFDAKVALGQVPSGGHAWVVLSYKGTDYVLEATSKRRINSIRDFVIAARATDYRPTVLFNRDHLWVNTGTPLTTRYQGQHWELRSRFIRERTRPSADTTL